MALKKTIALPTGVSGNYFRIVGFRWDRHAREASALFALFKDAATAAKADGVPLVPIAAKLRLSGDKFDAYVGPAALAATKRDVVGQLYAAAAEASVEFTRTGLKDARVQLVSDYGKGLFAGAEAV